jgi:hypothetical protein
MCLACGKDDEILLPSEKPEYGFHVPQGNNSYDTRILNYYNRFGTYLLYRFTNQEAYWSVTKWDSTYRVIPADTNYIDMQLDLLDTTFFRYYPDSTLKRFLPVKFLLCSSIKQSTGGQLDGYLTSSSNLGWVYETLVSNWGSDRILNIRGVKDTAVIFRGNFNYGFLRLLDLNGKTSRSDIFIAASDYFTLIPTTNTQAERFKRGFLGTGTNIPSNQNDWYNYLQAIVQNTYSFLADSTAPATDASNRGILNKNKDPNGLIKKKYSSMLIYYKNMHNVELQRIGDGKP